jgi:sulfatase maturation enzyme AslB (radical SAM superfamily)
MCDASLIRVYLKIQDVFKRPQCVVPLIRREILSNYTQNKSRGYPNILALDIEPTTKCNLDWKYCQVPWSNRSTKVKDLSLNQFKWIIDQFPSLQFIKLQGMGEPLKIQICRPSK